MASRCKRQPALLASLALALLVVAVGGGCSFGESGIAPPTNRIFLPGGIVVDPDQRYLYAVNSNSDLRYNAGTMVAVDLGYAASVLACAQDWTQSACQTAADPLLSKPVPPCTKTRFSRTEAVPDDYCCRDMVDSNIVNCNEPQFVHADATVEIGSFGGAVALQSFERDGVAVRRLFAAVRAEPSITYVDATIADDQSVAMRCTGAHDDPTPPPRNAFCDDNWRVRRPGNATPGQFALPEEPHLLRYDDANHALYVGHLTVTANAQLLGGGVSVLDVCQPAPGADPIVQLAGLDLTAFLPQSLQQAVAGLSDATGALPANASNGAGALGTPVVYATARYSAAISGLTFSMPPAPGACDATSPRDLNLVPGEHFYSPSFLPNGADVRGILFSADGSRAFVLHRNDSDTTLNPAALEVLDRTLVGGVPSNEPIAVLQVCNGPTAMQWKALGGRGERIFITCYDDGQIYVVDPVALEVTGFVDAGAGPTSLVFLGDTGWAYVASFANSHLSLIDFRPGSATENRVLLRIGLPHGYGE